MALAYLGDAYMWKAYRCPETKAENLQKAITVYKQIMNSGVYKLNPCFAANWDPAGVWNPEVIWAEVLDEGSNWNGWSNRTAFMMLKWFVGCTENGGWGTEFLSWEWYSCYEKGDKRRDASCATGPVKCWEYGDVVDDDGNVVEGRVKEIEDPWKVVDKTSAVYGYNPYLQQKLGKYKADGTLSPISQVPQYHCLANGEPAPSIWTTKLWRTARSDGDSWGYGVWAPISIYWKRLPNVMLDLAECLFETQGGDCAEAWDLINQLRERAFGNLESSLDVSRYIAHYNTIASHYGTEQLTTYPIPLNTQKVEVPDAKEYYTKLHDTPNRVGYTHTSPVWKIAVNEERRKEFNSEWCLRPDMQKSGYMADHIEYNYPIDNHPSDYASMRNYPWTARTFTYEESKMDMPIPSDELLRNSLCDQNPGY
jgi:hypothetical protein